MSNHDLFHYSVLIKTNDEAILNCLRSISQYSQKTGNSRISWGGTKKSDWINNDNKVKFHFSSAEYRNNFINECKRILPNNLIEICETNDKDIAQPQNNK